MVHGTRPLWVLIIDPGKSVWLHYSDVILGVMVSQITYLTIIYSTVYSDADQRKHQSSASLAFVWGIHRWPVNSPHKWPVTWKCFHLMTSCVMDVIVYCVYVMTYLRFACLEMQGISYWITGWIFTVRHVKFPINFHLTFANTESSKLLTKMYH